MARGHARGRGYGRQFDPAAPTLRVDPAGVNAVVRQGGTAPLSTNLSGGSGMRVANAAQTGAAMAGVSVSDGSAAEFDVSVADAANLSVTWSGSALGALAKGVYSRTITVTAAGAAGSPKAVPVRIEVV